MIRRVGVSILDGLALGLFAVIEAADVFVHRHRPPRDGFRF